MAKSDSHLYLGKNKADLATANNLYKYALEGFQDTNILKEQQGLTSLVINGYKVARSQLTEALLFGKVDACPGLAYLNKEGLGIAKSAYNEKLFLVIGSKLGNGTCTKALAALQNTNNVEKEANIWVNFIKSNSKGLDEEITSRAIYEVRTSLEQTLSDNSVNLDAYNSHIGIIKVDQPEAAPVNNIPRYPTTTPTYYQPPTDEHNTQPYMPSVKPLGQNVDKHHHCDIL